jgi:hypothetical protein
MGAGLEQILSLVYCGNGIVLAGSGFSTGDGDIYRSTDYGLTFTKIEMGAGLEQISSLVYCGNGIVLAGSGYTPAGDGDIYRSDVGFSEASTIQGIYHQHLTGNIGIGTTNPTAKLDVAGDVRVTGVVTATTFSGSGASLNSIPNGALNNSTVSYGGITLSLGGSDATPAFNLADATGLPVSSGISGLGANVATFLATASSANLASAVTDETGTGALVFATSPTLVTPVLGSASATSINVSGDISINQTTVIGSATSTLSSTSQTAIHTGLSTSTYRSVEYNIQATQGTNFHVTKILALHNGTTAYSNEYGSIFNNTYVALFDVDISAGNFRLLASGSTSSTTNYTINYTATKL